MYCSSVQPVAQSCTVCGSVLGSYYCAVCKLWNNNSQISIYHCSDCGVCRVGKGLGIDFFHCPTCRACLCIKTKSTHKCKEGLLDCKCPICWDVFQTSTVPALLLECGHPIHETCLKEYMKNGQYACPTCFQPVFKVQTTTTFGRITMRYYFQIILITVLVVAVLLQLLLTW